MESIKIMKAMTQSETSFDFTLKIMCFIQSKKKTLIQWHHQISKMMLDYLQNTITESIKNEDLNLKVENHWLDKS